MVLVLCTGELYRVFAHQVLTTRRQFILLYRPQRQLLLQPQHQHQHQHQHQISPAKSSSQPMVEED